MNGENSIAVERWGGRIEPALDAPIEFEVRVDRRDPLRAAIAIPAQQLDPTELVDVTFTDEEIRFTLALPGMTEESWARFDVARVNDRGSGVLLQNGAKIRVIMRRLADDETIGDGPPRPQTPKPPFPYINRLATYPSKDGTTLSGTLSVPEGSGRYLAVLLITGTGTQDRDVTMFGHKPFWILADHLARRGIAVLRVDDRGAGGSGGSTDDSGLEIKVDDALAGVGWLRRQLDIDPAHVGLIGHSEGGLVAAMAAAGSDEISLVVLLAAPGVCGSEIAMHQLERFLAADNASRELISVRLAGQRRLIDLSVGGADEATLRAAIAVHYDELAALSDVPVDEAARQAFVDSSIPPLASEAARSFLRMDPRAWLTRVRVPVLALWGERDLQVDPAQNLEPARAALSGSQDVTIEVLPGLNHLFQPAGRGTIDEYATIETTFDSIALDRIAGWLEAHR